MLDEKDRAKAMEAVLGNKDSFIYICRTVDFQLYNLAMINLSSDGYLPCSEDIMKVIYETAYRGFFKLKKIRFTSELDSWLMVLLNRICDEKKNTPASVESDGILKKVLSLPEDERYAVLYTYGFGLPLTQAADIMCQSTAETDILIKNSLSVIHEKELKRLSEELPKSSGGFYETVKMATDEAETDRKKKTKLQTVAFFITLIIIALVVSVFLSNTDMVEQMFGKTDYFTESGNNIPSLPDYGS